MEQHQRGLVAAEQIQTGFGYIFEQILDVGNGSHHTAEVEERFETFSVAVFARQRILLQSIHFSLNFDELALLFG